MKKIIVIVKGGVVIAVKSSKELKDVAVDILDYDNMAESDCDRECGYHQEEYDNYKQLEKQIKKMKTIY